MKCCAISGKNEIDAKECPTHVLNLCMIIQKIYAGLNFVSRNLLDSAAGGTFMEWVKPPNCLIILWQFIHIVATKDKMMGSIST